MRKVLKWRFGSDYEALLNHYRFEIYKKNITIVGIVCRERDEYFERKDGFYLYTPKNAPK